MAPVLAVIGGSGLDAVSELRDVEQIEISTPYGPPSQRITRGQIGETSVLFLPRHGEGHQIAPHRVNYRANICALRQLGATHVASISAVGSLRENIAPGQVVLVDQYIDQTRSRIATFFDSQIVAHVSMADPVCPELSNAALRAATRAGAQVHPTGTYLCIEGPQFSTRAESRLYRNWGADVIGMTAMPEAKLAREASLAYSTIALVTDYDCWHQDEANVTVEMVVAVLRRNVALARRIIAELASALPTAEMRPMARALDHAIMTDPSNVRPEIRSSLGWLIGG
jgi:5'-methylthioadenosine phosphorylase